MYSTAEAVLGELLTPAMHERAFLATKVWTRGEQAGIDADAAVPRSCCRCRELDLIQVHNLLDLDTQLQDAARLARSRAACATSA